VIDFPDVGSEVSSVRGVSFLIISILVERVEIIDKGVRF
jgi:hypothetical protein